MRRISFGKFLHARLLALDGADRIVESLDVSDHDALALRAGDGGVDHRAREEVHLVAAGHDEIDLASDSIYEYGKTA